MLGYSQNHLAVAGGCKRSALVAAQGVGFAPTRYREVVLTVSKLRPKALLEEIAIC